MAAPAAQQLVMHLSEEAKLSVTDQSLAIDGKNERLVHWPFDFRAEDAALDESVVGISTDMDDAVVCITLECKQEVFSSLECFVDASIAAERWHTFVLNGHNREWQKNDDTTVQVMSCNEVHGQVRSNWFANVPARVAAFDLGDAGWLAVSIPGAHSVARTGFHFHDGQFGLIFREYRPCEEAGPLRVFLRTGLESPLDALTFHAEMTRKLGYWKDRSNHPSWWSLPRWGMYDENCYIGHTSLDAPDARNSPLTAERLQQWAEQIRDITGQPEFFISYDQGYFRRYGEYLPVDSLGGVEGFRALIDEMRDDGIRTGLYCHPFHADVNIPELAANPEWYVKGHEPAAPSVAGDMCLTSLDWTHPDVPDYVRRVVRLIVSSEPGCLNADWLMVNNNHVPDPLECGFHDPDWGIGDRMAYKARKAIYDFAKEFKPDVLVSFIGCDPMLQETADMFWVNESWGETCDNWHQMAQVVTRCLPGTLVSANPYILSHGKHAEFVSVMPAYSMPSAMPLNYIHAHGHSTTWMPMTRENFRRWGASWRVYMNAPMTADQPRFVELRGDALTAWRKHAHGPLAGFYAGLALGRRGMVTYSVTEARAMVWDYVFTDVPLPPGATVTAVEVVGDDGAATPHPSTLINRDGVQSLRLELSDSGSGQTGVDGPCFYRIAYDLAKGG